ncbi:Voltage-gated Ion Channel [Phytophthora megakarya]|uniref:Voltage-gated Ion Channel n=1 Tax=Phytophthora megakarya TaxID=4795 RepID=A0A225VK10_9STRA|nr:Voltage-gated Ion Channel [Phytophthora megakarya]
MREYYRDEQLVEMEEECWRRYKVSLFMADAFTMTSRNDEDSTPTASKAARGIRVSRKTFCGAMLPGASPQRATRSLVTTDGMRFLENYESRNRPSQRGLHRKRKPRRSIELQHGGNGHEIHQSIGIVNVPSGAARAHRRQRKLKRSQSLPLFDRHFAFMIREELQDSNAKESDSKLNLGFELLQRCRQPEFSSLFRVYLSWLKRKNRWRQWYEHHFHGLKCTSSKAEDFVNFLARCYRLWEWVVVFVGLFYSVTIPFFVCFASDMITFHEENDDADSLVHWERFVVFIDVICIADFILKHSAFRRVLQLSAGGNTDIPTTRRPAPAAPPPLKSMGSSKSLTATPPQRTTHEEPKHWWDSLHGHHTFWDVVISLPLDLLLFFPPLSTSNISDHRWFYLSLFQLNKIPLVLESIEASERLTQFLSADLNLPISESRLNFFRTLCVYMLSGHWIACLWFRLGLHAYHIYEESWLSTYKMLPVDGFGTLSEIPTSRRYLRALHFAIGSITTIFYGDVVSMNVIETVVEIAFIVLCILIFGVLVGAQGEMIEANYKHKMLFEQNLMELYHFLKSSDVPREVRVRLRLYYTNTWLKYHGHDDLEGVRGLSTLLVEDIAQYTLRDFANQVSILKSCDESFLRSLLTCLKHIICSSSEPVVRKGDVDRSMYFIAKGKVLVQGPGFELVKHEGDFFGELSLLYGIPRSATCSSLGVSLLYVLEWETYERLLADYPEYREQNRREWVIVSTVLKKGESRFRSIIDIVARMEKANWVLVDEIIRKAKSLK